MKSDHQSEPGSPVGAPPPNGNATTARPSILQRVKQSFFESIGDIVFGMEDGTVSIFGLVFGVAASTNNSAAVLLAGATGAIAAAVSMMAGTYLDVESARDRARARLAHEHGEIQQDPQAEAQEATHRLQAAGFSEQDTHAIVSILRRTPHALLQFESAFELELGSATKQQPLVKALWMFGADVIAAFIPVLPFAFFPIASARIISVVVTTILLVLLGVGRGLIGHQNVIRTTLETVGIAAAAALAGVLIGRLITG